MTCIPKSFVDIELRQEIFFNLADLVFETGVSADCIRHWHEKMVCELQEYLDSFPQAERERRIEQLLEAAEVAVTLADTHTDAATLAKVVAILNTATTDACQTTFLSEYYQFFVLTATYGRRYYQAAGYDADSFVPSHYIFLAMSFDASLRLKLEQALHDQFIQ